MRFWSPSQEVGRRNVPNVPNAESFRLAVFRKRYPVLDPRYFDDPVAMGVSPYFASPT
jgi:hypothetical protein